MTIGIDKASLNNTLATLPEDVRKTIIGAMERTEEVRKQREKAPLAQQMTLFWDENSRPMSSALTKSALFTATRSVGKSNQLNEFNQPLPAAAPFKKNQRIFSTSDVIVYFTGEELNQDDLSVWMQIVYMSKDLAMDNLKIEVVPYRLLKALEWGTGKESYFKLKACLSRLRGGRVVVQQAYRGEDLVSVKDVNFLDSLEFYDHIDGTSAKPWELSADHQILKLFKPQVTSVHNWQQRIAIGKSRNALALSLHSIYSNHSGTPYPMLLTTLMQMTETKTKEVNRFKQQITKALDVLVNKKFVEKYDFDGKGKTLKLHLTLHKKTNKSNSVTKDA